MEYMKPFSLDTDRFKRNPCLETKSLPGSEMFAEGIDRMGAVLKSGVSVYIEATFY